MMSLEFLEPSSSLHKAAERADFESCERLLRHGACVNESNACSTPLLRALGICRNCSNICAREKSVELLLEYGADMSACGMKLVPSVIRGFKLKVGRSLDFAAVCNCESLKGLLIRHMVQMEYQNLDIDEEDQHTIERHTYYKTFYERCVQEIEDMKKAKFYNNVTIFHIFMNMKNKKVVSGYARNEELVRALDNKCYAEKYPIYFASLKKKFDAMVEEQRLQYNASKILSNIFKLNDGSHAVILRIFSFLREEDLKYFEL